MSDSGSGSHCNKIVLIQEQRLKMLTNVVFKCLQQGKISLTNLASGQNWACKWGSCFWVCIFYELFSVRRVKVKFIDFYLLSSAPATTTTTKRFFKFFLDFSLILLWAFWIVVVPSWYKFISLSRALVVRINRGFWRGQFHLCFD